MRTRGPRAAGVNAAKDDTQQVSKHIHLLENKVEAALIKLNEAVGRNKLLRESIDNLRLERVVFDQVRPCKRCCCAPVLTLRHPTQFPGVPQD